jgi:hypothetical protein
MIIWDDVPGTTRRNAGQNEEREPMFYGSLFEMILEKKHKKFKTENSNMILT